MLAGLVNINTTQAQQKALDDALVAPVDHLEFMKCNMRLKTDIKPKEATFQICPKIPRQRFEEPLLEHDILSFLRDIGHTGDIHYITDVSIDYLHQPWRAFATIINKCLSGKDTAYEKIRLSCAQILWGMYKNKNIDYMYLLWEDFLFQVWICQISQEISQKRTRERMSDQEAKEIKAEAREIIPQPSTFVLIVFKAWSLYWIWMAAETPRVLRAVGQLIAGKLRDKAMVILVNPKRIETLTLVYCLTTLYILVKLRPSPYNWNKEWDSLIPGKRVGYSVFKWCSWSIGTTLKSSRIFHLTISDTRNESSSG
ncbi:hypothetical protein Tco_0731033 [Tanacetum coccineum]